MIPGGLPRHPPYRRCPGGCGCNVAQIYHEPGSEECREALEARLHTYEDDDT